MLKLANPLWTKKKELVSFPEYRIALTDFRAWLESRVGKPYRESTVGLAVSDGNAPSRCPIATYLTESVGATEVAVGDVDDNNSYVTIDGVRHNLQHDDWAIAFIEQIDAISCLFRSVSADEALRYLDAACASASM